MRFIVVAIIGILVPCSAYAGDAATIIFRSGQVLQVGDGYRAIVEAMRTLNSGSTDHKISELTLGGSEVALNVAEIVLVCRDSCRGMEIKHQLDPRRGAARDREH